MVSYDDPSHGAWILWSRGGGGVTPGLLDMRQQIIHLGADHRTHHLHQNTEHDPLPFWITPWESGTTPLQCFVSRPCHAQMSVYCSCRRLTCIRAVVVTVCVHVVLRHAAFCQWCSWRASVLAELWLLGQPGTAMRPVLADITCTAERETWIVGMFHNVKPTHQVSLLSVDSLWVQLFVQMFFWWWVYMLKWLALIDCLSVCATVLTISLAFPYGADPTQYIYSVFFVNLLIQRTLAHVWLLYVCAMFMVIGLNILSVVGTAHHRMHIWLCVFMRACVFVWFGGWHWNDRLLWVGWMWAGSIAARGVTASASARRSDAGRPSAGTIDRHLSMA